MIARRRELAWSLTSMQPATGNMLIGPWPASIL
jgi:hypothetical protein